MAFHWQDLYLLGAKNCVGITRGTELLCLDERNI